MFSLLLVCHEIGPEEGGWEVGWGICRREGARPGGASKVHTSESPGMSPWGQEASRSFLGPISQLEWPLLLPLGCASDLRVRVWSPTPSGWRLLLETSRQGRGWQEHGHRPGTGGWEVRGGGQSWGPSQLHIFYLIAVKVWSQKAKQGDQILLFLLSTSLQRGKASIFHTSNPEPGCPKGLAYWVLYSGPGDLDHKLPGCLPCPRSRPLGDEMRATAHRSASDDKVLPLLKVSKETCPDGWPAEPKKAASTPPFNPLTQAGGSATQRQLKIESKNKLLSGVWRGAQQVGVGPGPWGASAGWRGENQASQTSRDGVT